MECHDLYIFYSHSTNLGISTNVRYNISAQVIMNYGPLTSLAVISRESILARTQIPVLQILTFAAVLTRLTQTLINVCKKWNSDNGIFILEPKSTIVFFFSKNIFSGLFQCILYNCLIFGKNNVR